jgi:cyclophilin family peptidyl-prolyl cis-trans isomerase
MFRRSLSAIFTVVVCTLGWIAAGQGWLVAADGRSSIRDVGATAGAWSEPATAQQSSKPGQKVVQAPPLKAPAPALKPAPGNPVVVMSTSKGDITLELFKERAPASVANFLEYARSKFYDGTIFHRVIPGFMIQGGGFTPSLDEKPTRDPIQNEATNGLRNTRGTLAMARRQSLRSATSQFYINVADNRMLDHVSFSPGEFGYAVFGRVLSGMDVVDKIVAVRTGVSKGMTDVPVEPVVITRVTVKP